MSRKQESIDTSKFLTALQKMGWFRNITDHFQIGIPDIIGGYKGLLYGFEIKSISFVPEDGWAPLKKDHCFTPKQIEELKSINRSGGCGIGIVICGPNLYYAYPIDINKDGQINCYELSKKGQYLKRSSQEWDVESFLDKIFLAISLPKYTQGLQR
jgi:hypothetical protein